MRAFDGFVDLVEIKKPNGLQFWSATKDHNNYVPVSYTHLDVYKRQIMALQNLPTLLLPESEPLMS